MSESCPYNASDEKPTPQGACMLTKGHAGKHRLALEGRPLRCVWIEGHGYLHPEACERGREEEKKPMAKRGSRSR